MTTDHLDVCCSQWLIHSIRLIFPLSPPPTNDLTTPWTQASMAGQSEPVAGTPLSVPLQAPAGAVSATNVRGTTARARWTTSWCPQTGPCPRPVAAPVASRATTPQGLHLPTSLPHCFPQMNPRQASCRCSMTPQHCLRTLKRWIPPWRMSLWPTSCLLWPVKTPLHPHPPRRHPLHQTVTKK